MKSFCIITLTVLIVACTADYYEEHDLDIESVVSDLKSLKVFADCFNDKGPCDEKLQKIKVIIPEAIKQACKKCTAEQKQKVNMFLKGFEDKLPSEYEVYRKKYDAENKYFPALLAAVE